MTPGRRGRAAGLVAAAAGGLVLGAAVGLVAAVRRDRPMHAVGRTYRGVLRRTPAPEPAGVPWIDRPGEQTVLVRFSRGAGLPPWAPDVQGIAVRLAEPGGGSTDVLLSSTGLRGPARFVLVPRRSPFGGAASSLMPFRGPRGPLLLAAEPLAPDGASRAERRTRRRDASPDLSGSRWRLLWSGPTGPWRQFAVLDVGPDAGPDVDRRTRFDPIGAAPPGMPSPRWAALLRAPAYRAARLLGRRPRAGGVAT